MRVYYGLIHPGGREWHSADPIDVEDGRRAVEEHVDANPSLLGFVLTEGSSIRAEYRSVGRGGGKWTGGPASTGPAGGWPRQGRTLGRRRAGGRS